MLLAYRCGYVTLRTPQPAELCLLPVQDYGGACQPG